MSSARIDIVVTRLSDTAAIDITITDDGIGLDAEQYRAFCEIDTDFKRSKGGFTRAFSSDKRLDDILVQAGSADRADLFL